MNNKVTAMRLVATLFFALALSGCAIIEDNIAVNYVAPPNLSVVEGASAVSVSLSGEDARVANKDRVSTKKNGYGMEMAAIRAKNDVVQLVKSAVEHELTSLGFKVGESNERITISLDTFYNDFKPGFWSGNAVAEVAFTLKAYKSDGRLIYSRSYKGVGMENGIMIYSGDNANAALQKALTNAMSTVIADQDLHRALVDGAAPVTAQGAPSS